MTDLQQLMHANQVWALTCKLRVGEEWGHGVLWEDVRGCGVSRDPEKPLLCWTEWQKGFILVSGRGSAGQVHE